MTMETNGADSHNDAVSMIDLVAQLAWKMLVLESALSNPDGVLSAEALEEMDRPVDFKRLVMPDSPTHPADFERLAKPFIGALQGLRDAARKFVDMKLFEATFKGDGDESRVVSWHITDRDRAEHLMRLFKAEASSIKSWADSQLR
jgi:hypothetical protein